MAIGVGISGPRGGGGGVPTLADPASFADANALFLGDRGLTLVGNTLDIWENQGTDGTNASAATLSNRVGLQMGLGAYGYRDFYPNASVNFYNTGMNSSALTAFTFEGVVRVRSNWNPERLGPSVGNINGTDYPAICWQGNGGFRVTQRVAGTNTNTYWSRAAIGMDNATPFAYTLVYNGAEAVNADRLKLYINGVFVASTTTPTHPTSVSNQYGRIEITSSITTYSSHNPFGGYVGYWERVLSADEIAANQTWRESIWAVTP